MSELPTRPPLRPAHPLLGWLRWIGPARVAGGAVVALGVIAIGYWLMRPPELPVEASLPYTSTAVATLPIATGGGRVVVHVAGAVARPGVYDVAEGGRVVDAVAAAGGLAADAAADVINLAARVTDGERIYVPRLGETPPPTVGGTGSTLIDINRADAAELETLPGIGPTTAAAIVAHRDTHGPFASVDDLADVTGIGPSKLAAIRELVTV